MKIATTRLWVRCALLLLFLALSLSGLFPSWLDSLTHASNDGFAAPREPLPGFLKGVLPSLSPFAVFLSCISLRELCLMGALALAFAALLLALWRGRVFCAWICPLGTLVELESKLPFKGFFKKLPKINGIIFWAVVTGAFLGLPVLLAFDPLASFSRLSLLLHWPFPLAALIPMAVVLRALVLGPLKPLLWCSNVCPLGFALGFAQKLRQNISRLCRRESPDTGFVVEGRRDFIKGVCVGLPLAVASEAVIASSFEAKSLPVLPPGALDPLTFNASCTRCYACVASCPSKVLTVELPKDMDVPSWFAPHLNAARSACTEDCNRCSQVCATGAIKPVSKEEKRNIQIGLARVDHANCLAWSKGEQCMVCEEYCPYKAIKNDPAPDGTPRPVIMKDKCRGCGFCQMSCPGIGHGAAIKVTGVLSQRRLQL